MKKLINCDNSIRPWRFLTKEQEVKIGQEKKQGRGWDIRSVEGVDQAIRGNKGKSKWWNHQIGRTGKNNKSFGTWKDHYHLRYPEESFKIDSGTWLENSVTICISPINKTLLRGGGVQITEPNMVTSWKEFGCYNWVYNGQPVVDRIRQRVATCGRATFIH